MSTEDHAYDEAEEVEAGFDLDNLPPVPEAPRTLGPALAGALGLLLLGVGGAIGSALALGAPPFDALAETAIKLGVTPGVTAAAGLVAIGVALACSGLAGLLRRAIDTLDLASDPVPLLERADDRLLRLEDRLTVLEQRTAQSLRAAVQPVADRLANLEAAVAVAGSAVQGSDPSSDAVWRLAASMDQIRAQLDQRLEQQLASYERHLAAELERTSHEHVAALERALTESRRQLEQEADADPRRETVTDASPEPAAGRPTESQLRARVEVSAPAARGRESQEFEEREESEIGAGSLGVFDQLDDHGQPKAPLPRPSDVAHRRTPTQPMPDIYGGAEQLPDVDAVAGVRPRRKPQSRSGTHEPRG